MEAIEMVILYSVNLKLHHANKKSVELTFVSHSNCLGIFYNHFEHVNELFKPWGPLRFWVQGLRFWVQGRIFFQGPHC